MVRILSAAFVMGLAIIGAGTACGQNYPVKPLRILTSEAGAGNDYSARVIAQGITAPLGQPVIVENRASLIGVEMVAKAPPDGYTLIYVGSSMWILPYMRDHVPWDSERDFAPITVATSAPNILVVYPSLPINSVGDLIALAKSKPGELNYAAGATGSAVHLAAELFNAMAGVKIVRIAYKSSAPALIDLTGGRVQIMFSTANSAMPFVKSAKLRAVAVTSAQPSALFPGLPTVAATGLPGYEMTVLTGMFAPAKTPPAIIKRLNEEMVRVLNTAQVKEKFLTQGADTIGSTPEQFAAAIKVDIAKLSKLIKDAGIRADD